MKKGVRLSLIIITFLALLFLGYNLYNYINYQKELISLNQEIDTIKNNNSLRITEKESLEKEIKTLEENNQDKLKLYNKWKSHKKSLEEKMN